jgi:hypothetical protein
MSRFWGYQLVGLKRFTNEVLHENGASKSASSFELSLHGCSLSHQPPNRVHLSGLHSNLNRGAKLLDSCLEPHRFIVLGTGWGNGAGGDGRDATSARCSGCGRFLGLVRGHEHCLLVLVREHTDRSALVQEALEIPEEKVVAIVRWFKIQLDNPKWSWRNALFGRQNHRMWPRRLTWGLANRGTVRRPTATSFGALHPTQHNSGHLLLRCRRQRRVRRP